MKAVTGEITDRKAAILAAVRGGYAAEFELRNAYFAEATKAYEIPRSILRLLHRVLFEELID